MAKNIKLYAKNNTMIFNTLKTGITEPINSRYQLVYDVNDKGYVLGKITVTT